MPSENFQLGKLIASRLRIPRLHSDFSGDFRVFCCSNAGRHLPELVLTRGSHLVTTILSSTDLQSRMQTCECTLEQRV